MPDLCIPDIWCSGNIGTEGLALMEAVHGTAPDIAGKVLISINCFWNMTQVDAVDDVWGEDEWRPHGGDVESGREQDADCVRTCGDVAEQSKPDGAPTQQRYDVEASEPGRRCGPHPFSCT